MCDSFAVPVESFLNLPYDTFFRRPVLRFSATIPRVRSAFANGGATGRSPVYEALWSALLFSEGNALYLWQIRHIPNDRQTLLRLTLFSLCLGSLAATYYPSTPFVAAQTTEADSNTTHADGKATPAEDFLDRVRQELPKHQSIKADVIQSVSIGDQKFSIAGSYLSAGQKLKLDYQVQPNQGAVGSMTEVCDGKELWTLLQFQERTEVTQRNVQQILEAASTANANKTPESTIKVELGLGGVSTLLASLNRTMSFDTIKAEEVEGQSMTMIQGRWKKEVLDKLPKDRNDTLPPFLPDLVRILINSQTLFPEKFLYLKKTSQTNKYRKLVTLEFQNVQFDVPVDESVFVFQVPKGIIPVDVTKQYIERLTPPVVPAVAPAK